MRNTNAENTMGTRIREMRKAAGMSQEQLAEILCTKKATISAYENDHIDIKSSIVLEIAKALNCSGSYLLEGKKAEALDVRIMDALLELKNDQMREVALKQIQALALLGYKYILNRLLSIVWGTIFTPWLSTIISVKKSKRTKTHDMQQ